MNDGTFRSPGPVLLLQLVLLIPHARERSVSLIIVHGSIDPTLVNSTHIALIDPKLSVLWGRVEFASEVVFLLGGPDAQCET
jgi:hypothetical protein